MSTGMGSGQGEPDPWRWPRTQRRLRPPEPPAPPPQSPALPARPRPVPPLYPGQSAYRAGAPPRAAGYRQARPDGLTGDPDATSAQRSRGENADAGALAAAFAADFLSWDEADPARRGRALSSYAAPSAREEDLAVAGWAGRGRQRTELALPGTIVRLGPNRVLVHVRVRVTPFRRRAEVPAGSRTHTSRDLLPFPAGAPAPAHPQWEGLDSYWYELLIPLAGRDRWRVDIGAVIVVPPLPNGDEPDDLGVDVGEQSS